jgi:hypothetical protein
LVTGALALTAPSALAEPTTWLAFGGGYGSAENGFTSQRKSSGLYSQLIGVGTTPTNPWVIGGVFRTATFMGLGTDISLATRIATGRFARGDWGAALDLGVTGRFWKDQAYGHLPFSPVLTLGAPYGAELAIGAQLADVSGDSPKASSFFVVFEIDLLRLTAMRSGDTTKYWPSPSAIDGARPPPDETPPP